MILAFDAKRAYQNATGLGSYARNHLFMVAALDEVSQILALTPKVNILDQRLNNPKIQILQPEHVWQLIPALWRRTRLGRIAEQYKAQIFHGLSAELPEDIGLFSGKKVVTVHDVLFKTRPWEYSAFDRRMHDYKLQKALEAADKVVCISHQTLNELSNAYQINQAKCEVIYQPVHPDFYKAETFKELINPPFKKFILSVGTVEPRKNTLALLQAIELLNLPIVLIGRIKKSYSKNVLPIIERLIKKQLLYRATPKDSKELAAWYHHAHIVVYPSVAEGFGLPPLEAAAAGRVCITGPSPCLTEASGLPELQTSGNSDDLANTIQSLWNKPQYLEHLEQKARKHADHLRIENIKDIWRSFYVSLIQN
ncbi:glycosyl transferase family 1 [Thermaurantimonas aggregans]|uniref:Glycosyl transferase family 1 n=1 Tax=Thermaurantimonas aggregans TaxID=2173829 RepID=A0A401XNS7_9FLAO|nr:glycosyltransferase family 1 protein [Thermaurantimonas aggregans]MCX8148854.1 glycosyltransferase family 4 protein [Thermaurantimonas aggregans]GCD78671.1 glycosyl transferase family 1 [Thermaurantimonas aggregans]